MKTIALILISIFLLNGCQITPDKKCRKCYKCNFYEHKCNYKR